MRRAPSQGSVKSGVGSTSGPTHTFIHNLPNAMHIIKEIDEHLTVVNNASGMDNSTSHRSAVQHHTMTTTSGSLEKVTSLVDLDATAVAHGNVVHVIPPSNGKMGSRTLLCDIILAQEKRLNFCWWVAASSVKFLTLSLGCLADALDHSESVSKLDGGSEAVQEYVEHQKQWGRCAAFVLEDATNEVVVDFLARLAPRWGVHIIVLPSTRNPHIDANDIQTMCSEVRFPTYPAPILDEYEQEQVNESIAAGNPNALEELVEERHKRRCEALVPHLYGGFVDESWLVKAVSGPECRYRLLLVRMCITAMENFKCDSYTLYHKIQDQKAANPGRENDISAIFRVFAASLPSNEDRKWLWAIVALPRMVPNCIVPDYVANLLAQSGLITHHFVQGSNQKEPVVMTSFPSWLYEAYERSATVDELEEAFTTIIGKLEELSRLHLHTAVPLPQWSATSVEVTAINAQGDDVSVLTTALINEQSDIFRESHQQQTWRIWGPDIIKFIVEATRWRRLFFPRIAQLLIPETDRKLKINDVPELPEDTKEWTSKLVTKYIRQANRLIEEARSLEAASACEKVICVMSHIAEQPSHINNMLLLHGLCYMYRKVASIYVSTKIEGLAETYTERAVSLLDAINGRRRDTPARAVTLITSGKMFLNLSAAEKRRAQVVRESQILTDASNGSDMQLRVGVKAEVGEKQYLHEASQKFKEATEVLKSVPEGLVGEELSMCHEAISHAHHVTHKERDALRSAEAALDCIIDNKRAPYTTASREKKQTAVDLRDEITWALSNMPQFLDSLRQRDYKKANELLDLSLFLSHCVMVPSLHNVGSSATSSTKQTYVYCDGGDLKNKLVENTFPLPKFFESTQLWATFSEATMAKHHGKDWQQKTHEYLIPAHELLKHSDAESADATALLRRILDSGMSPHCASPHDGKTLLHIALERHMAAAVQVLVSHSHIDVEYKTPYILQAERRGLSTVAAVDRIPSDVLTPIEFCDDPLLLLTLLLQGKTPHETFHRNRVSVVERLGLQEDATHLANILAPGRLFHSEVYNLLTMGPDENGHEITSETKERIAAYCPDRDVLRAINAVDDEHVVQVLAQKIVELYDDLEANRLLCAATTHFIKTQRVMCAERILSHFPINLEMLFWEDAAEYNRMLGEMKKKLKQEQALLE